MRRTSTRLWVCGLLLLVGGCGPKATGPAAETPAPVEPEPAPTIDQRLTAADEAAERGEYQAALLMFRQILAENPTAAAAYVGIGEVYLAQEDYERAEPVLARAARLEPRNFDAQYGHAVALQMLDRLAEAVRAFHRALTIRPDSIEANLHVADIYLRQGRPESSLVFAEKVVQLDPASGPGRARLGAVYQELGRPTDAVGQYEAAVELMEPPPAPLLLNLVRALIDGQRYVDARNTVEHLIRVAPSAEAYERLGYCHFRVGDYDQSLAAYRRATQIDPDHWPALNGVGCNALNKWLLSGKSDAGAVSEARAALRRSLQINPDQQRVIALLAQYGV